MSANKAPAEKLPLAVRKNVRDEFENKKAELEQQISTLLGGTAWKIDVNPLAIYPYAEEGSYGQNSLGGCITAYIEGLIYNLKPFSSQHGEAGVSELNAVADKHSITLLADDKPNYCGCDISAGVLRILFNPRYLGTNITDATSGLADAISAAPAPSSASSLSYTARHAIQTGWEPEIGPILEKCQGLLQNGSLKFEPDFEANGKVLKGSKDAPGNWERQYGFMCKEYYRGFQGVLQDQKFGDDEMLREGFEEGVPKGVVRMRVVEKLQKGSYNEAILEDGELIMQTTPSNWGVNVNDVAFKLVDLL